IEKLKAVRGRAVHVAGLFHGEHRSQLLPTDVQVERVGLDVEELAGGTEAPEPPVNLDRCRTVGHQNPYRTYSLQAPQQFLPPGNVQLHDPIRRKGPNNLDLRHAEVSGQLQRHFSGVLFHRSPNALRHPSWLTRLAG